jgi:hypothetical protein
MSVLFGRRSSTTSAATWRGENRSGLPAAPSKLLGPAEVRVQLKNVTVKGASSTLSFPDSRRGRAKNRLVVYRQIGLKTQYLLPPVPEPYRTTE